MQKKKLFTLEDLYDFYVNKNEDILFSAQKEHTSLVVQVEFDSDYIAEDGLLAVHLKSCHILENRNHSYISKESMEEAIPSFYNRPILGYIHQLSDGSYDFAGHEMEIDEDGNVIYKEIPIGVIPESCKANLVYDKDEDKTYLEVNGYIFEGYTKAADILRKKENSKVSVELSIDEMSYSAKDKVLTIDRFHFMGVTILGKDIDTEAEIQEGMKGAKISVSDFSADKNSMFSSISEEQYNEIMSQIAQLKEKIKEGGNGQVKLKELLEKYNKTVEDLNFEYEGLSDEELEAKFEEVFAAQTDDSIKKYSIQIGDQTYTFEVSMNETIRALETLINNTYSEADNAYYSVKAYDSYVIMIDYWSDKAYKQNYNVENDSYSLNGDREEVYANYLTKSEEQAIDDLRANYAEVTKKLEAYASQEEEAKKQAIIEDEAYSCICESEEFTALVDKIADYSSTELESACDSLLKKFTRENKNFSMGSQKKIRVGAKKEENYSPYGSLFSKEELEK